MGNFGETSGKKDRDKKKAKQRQEKVEKMQDRKAHAKKGKSLEDMMAYVDENGNISSTPPDQRNVRKYRQEDMQISTPKYDKSQQEDVLRTGVVTFFNEAKGFGFIKDLQSQASVFMHVNQVSERIKENDKVTFGVENGPKGLNAVNITKIS